MTKRITKNHCDAVLSEESYSYDAAGNITGAPSSSFRYDTNNRLTRFNGSSVSYDLDGNMLSNGSLTCTYDSANRLISAGGSTYTYNAEDVRIRQYRYGADTTYVYDTNVKLSRMLMKTTNGIVTKYVYGLGLIGEEKEACFKTYHFDSRGSTIAITNTNGTITDTFAYDTYGKVTSHVGSSFVIFGYNGRDGVVTDDNGLIYMRARYYSPKMRRFINADIIPGEISNAITLNRFAYANGNPVSYIDPFGLSADKNRGNSGSSEVVDALLPMLETIIWLLEMENTVSQWRDNTINKVSNWWNNLTNSVSSWWDNTTDKAIAWWEDNTKWIDKTVEWLNENARNKDGSYAIYDNHRHKDSVFHEQILAVTPSGLSFDLRTGDIGLGSLEVDAITGGWEGEHANLSLLDFGHAEASFEMKDYQVSVGAFASAWSPSFSISFFGVTLEIGAEVGAVGASGELGAHGGKLKMAGGVGFTLGLTW